MKTNCSFYIPDTIGLFEGSDQNTKHVIHQIGQLLILVPSYPRGFIWIINFYDRDSHSATAHPFLVESDDVLLSLAGNGKMISSGSDPNTSCKVLAAYSNQYQLHQSPVQ